MPTLPNEAVTQVKFKCSYVSVRGQSKLQFPKFSLKYQISLCKVETRIFISSLEIGIRAVGQVWELHVVCHCSSWNLWRKFSKWRMCLAEESTTVIFFNDEQ